MKAEEIRSKVLRSVHHIPPETAFELEILQEIAAQLAELNEARSEAAKPRMTFTEAEWNGDSISVESFLAPQKQELRWTREAPTEPGWYWYRDVSGMQITNAEYSMGYADPEHIVFTIVGIGDAFNGEIMLRHGGEFWSEKLEEPK